MAKHELISSKELGRRLNVSGATIRKALRDGALTSAHIDAKGKYWFTEKAARKQINAAQAARDGQEAAQAKILMLKAQQMEKELVNVGDVARMWEKHVGDARRLFLALPAQFAKDVPALADVDVALIENRISAILDVLPSQEHFLDNLSK